METKFEIQIWIWKIVKKNLVVTCSENKKFILEKSKVVESHEDGCRVHCLSILCVGAVFFQQFIITRTSEVEKTIRGESSAKVKMRKGIGFLMISQKLLVVFSQNLRKEQSAERRMNETREADLHLRSRGVRDISFRQSRE